jgi:thymidylate synthase
MKQLDRELFPSPTVEVFNEKNFIEELSWKDVVLENYIPHGFLKYELNC